MAGLNPDTTCILDVRGRDERAAGFIPGSVHIPINELRQRIAEVPADREIIAYCASGLRSYVAARFLTQHGFTVKNLSGAYRTWATATGGGR